MGELLGILGVLLGLWFLVAPAVTLITSLNARRRVEELEGRIWTLERELELLRSRPPVVEKKLAAPTSTAGLLTPAIAPAALDSFRVAQEVFKARGI